MLYETPTHGFFRLENRHYESGSMTLQPEFALIHAVIEARTRQASRKQN